MWECLEGKVEIVFELGIGESLRFRERVPNAMEILREGSLEIGEGCSAQVIADDEEKEGALRRAIKL